MQVKSSVLFLFQQKSFRSEDRNRLCIDVDHVKKLWDRFEFEAFSLGENSPQSHFNVGVQRVNRGYTPKEWSKINLKLGFQETAVKLRLVFSAF